MKRAPAGIAGDLIQILPSVQARFNYPGVGSNLLQSLSWQRPALHFKFLSVEKRRETQIALHSNLCGVPPAPGWLLHLPCTGRTMGCNLLWEKHPMHIQITL